MRQAGRYLMRTKLLDEFIAIQDGIGAMLHLIGRMGASLWKACKAFE